MLVMLIFIYFLITSLLVVIGVAYITLLERKILGFIQLRYGPNKVGIVGILQPFSDAFKLLSKSEVKFIYISSFKYVVMPLGMFVVMLLLWCFIPSGSMVNNYSNSGLIIICLMSLGVFPVILGSWFSLSIYSMIGSLRCVAQMISYEVSLIMIMVGFYLYLGSFKLVGFVSFISLIFMLPLIFLLFFSCLMEVNRTPSDLIEGESELVSGFNTEYYGLNFSMIFLGEYGSIMFMCSFMALLVFGINSFSLVGVLVVLGLIYFIIMLRGSLPRVRYDFLMYLCWTSVLSVSLGYMILIFGLLSFMW